MKKVRDFMTRDLTSVTEDASLQEAAELLSLHALSGMPVVDRENIVTGYISEKDIVASIFPEKIKVENPDVVGFGNFSQVIKKLGRVGKARVLDYMIKNVEVVTEDTSVGDVAEIMIQKDLRRISVVRNKRLVGIVDRSSISSIILEEGSI